jgi:hypothetical protein
VHAEDFLARHREQPERIVLAQVGLLEERDAREVLEGVDVLGRVDSRLAKSLGAEPLTG